MYTIVKANDVVVSRNTPESLEVVTKMLAVGETVYNDVHRVKRIESNLYAAWAKIPKGLMGAGSWMQAGVPSLLKPTLSKLTALQEKLKEKRYRAESNQT